MPVERTISTRRIYSGRVIGLRVDTIELPSGKRTEREIVEHKGCAVIVPVDDKGDVLLVRQYRKAVERELLELPAGGIDPGEGPEQCAIRELVEETGFRAAHIEPLGGFYSSPGFSTEYMHLFLATGLSPAGDRPKPEDENIEVVPVPLKDAPRLIASGEVCDAKSVAGLLLALRHIQRP